jgi:hypothetical protein
MSVFDFSAILPAAIEQAGYHAVYVARYWKDLDKEQEKREQAQAAIIEGIDRGIPAIVWDIADAEWGLVTGYNQDKQAYYALNHKGESSLLAFNKLGRNGIDILSVAIPGEANQRSRDEIIQNSLIAAVDHAEQKEWMDRPKYQDGFPAYDLWASLLEKWAMLVESGKAKNLNPDIWNFAAYYAGHYYSARCYARDYLKSIANADDLLIKAASCYETVASYLKPVWDYFSVAGQADAQSLSLLSASIKQAKIAEAAGINLIKEYLTNQ